jgi:hypothetical protein
MHNLLIENSAQMSYVKRKQAVGAEESSKKRHVKPADITMHAKTESNIKVNTLRKLLDTPTPYSMTAIGPSAYEMCVYASQCQHVLAEVIKARLKADGALSRQTMRPGGRRRSTPIAHHMTVDDIELLKKRRNEWHNHLKSSTTMLLKAPPASGGKTAFWGLGTALWVLVCHANTILRYAGVAADLCNSFSAVQSRYLCRNLLALFPQPVIEYSLTQLVMTLVNAIHRLDLLDGFDNDYAALVGVLEYRCAELICLSGTAITGYDCKQWQESASTSVDGMRGHEQCSDKFICHSMLWFLSLHHYMDAHRTVLSVYSRLAIEEGRDVGCYVSAAQTYALRWFPSADVRGMVRAFFYEYALGMQDQRYIYSMFTYFINHVPLPGDAFLYRLHQQTEEAQPRNVLNHAAMTHHSPGGMDYVRNVQFTVPVLTWLHESINWRAGDESVRSQTASRAAYFRELACLFTVHAYMGKFGIRFRQRFVMHHRSPAFFANYIKAKRNGWPFIVQQFAQWCVVVPHAKEPVADGVEWAAAMETASMCDARAAQPIVEERAAAVPPPPPLPSSSVINIDDDDNDADDKMAADADDDDDEKSSGSYSYYSYYDDEYDSANSDDDEDFERLLQPHKPPDVVRQEAAAAAAAATDKKDASGNGEEDLDDMVREFARMAVDVEADERGEIERIEMAKTYGANLPPIAANEEWVRVYECRSFFDAFTLWAVALLRCNGGVIDKTNLTDFFYVVFGWQKAKK